MKLAFDGIITLLEGENIGILSQKGDLSFKNMGNVINAISDDELHAHCVAVFQEIDRAGKTRCPFGDGHDTIQPTRADCQTYYTTEDI